MSRTEAPYFAIPLSAFFSASVFMSPFCGLLFGCGCSWLWTTAAAHCNIHHAAPPHCPWCSFGYFGYALPFLGFLILQTAAGWLTLHRTQRLFWSVLTTVVSMLPAGLLMAGITRIVTR